MFCDILCEVITVITSSEIVVRYQETDQMGIVHHSVYPVWYEVARTDYCKQMGLRYLEMESMGIMTPIYEVHSHYKSPARYDDVLTVQTIVKRLTPYRIEFRYEIFKEDTLIHYGETVHVWVDSKEFKPLNLKKYFPDVYQLIESTMEESGDAK